MREKVILACTECGDRNYVITKNKSKHPERIEVVKFCKRLNKRTVHKETR